MTIVLNLISYDKLIYNIHKGIFIPKTLRFTENRLITDDEFRPEHYYNTRVLV